MNLFPWRIPRPSPRESLTAQSIPAAEAYHCRACNHIVFRTVQGHCPKCQSGAVTSVLREADDLAQRIVLLEKVLQRQRALIRFLRTRTHKLLFLLAASDQRVQKLAKERPGKGETSQGAVSTTLSSPERLTSPSL
jgi:hypothetical protein